MHMTSDETQIQIFVDGPIYGTRPELNPDRIAERQAVAPFGREEGRLICDKVVGTR